MKLRTYLQQHHYALLGGLSLWRRDGVGTVLTVAVIAVVLALPALLYTALDNLQRVSQGWLASTELSVFLKMETPPARVEATAAQLRRLDGVAHVRVLTPQEGLAELKKISGMADALRALETNPLPAVLIVRPHPTHNTPPALAQLTERLQRLPGADFVQLDTQWVQRLHAVLQLGRNAAALLALLLASATLLIVGHAIRTAIDDKREEINILRLVGASSGFVRRPFLYSGLGLGLMGGLVAWVLVAGSFWLLADSAQHLGILYGSNFALHGPQGSTVTVLVMTGAFLGLIASWAVVSRHLRATEGW